MSTTPTTSSTADHLRNTAWLPIDPRQAHLACNEDGGLRVCFAKPLVSKPYLGFWLAVERTVMR
ncbi:MAG: hypothetical protein V4787_11545 [Pseudomonadota bacterium]